MGVDWVTLSVFFLFVRYDACAPALHDSVITSRQDITVQQCWQWQAWWVWSIASAYLFVSSLSCFHQYPRRLLPAVIDDHIPSSILATLFPARSYQDALGETTAPCAYTFVVHSHLRKPYNVCAELLPHNITHMGDNLALSWYYWIIVLNW